MVSKPKCKGCRSRQEKIEDLQRELQNQQEHIADLRRLSTLEAASGGELMYPGALEQLGAEPDEVADEPLLLNTFAEAFNKLHGVSMCQILDEATSEDEEVERAEA